MEELEDNISTDNKKDTGGLTFKIKPKKRSLVERELETNLTERVTSPITYTNCTNTSRYGRARRLKTNDSNDAEKSTTFYKSPPSDQTPVKSPVYKMHASNSPIRVESPTKQSPNSLDHQIETIYSENISLSRFSSEKKCRTSAKKPSPKVYISKDLIQTKEKEESVVLIKNYSPSSNKKSKHLSSVLQRSSERFNLNNNKHNGYLDNSSVVKTLDFDGNRKKKNKETKAVPKSDLFEMEAKCEYQVGDLAWARMGTYPYWPCIVTRDPYSGMFVKKKLLGRVDRDYIHVTFFGDNGRRSWILDNMLRKFLGQHEFETTRKTFTPEAKKKDPRCAAFFVSEKKQPQWTKSVDEAETFLKEPKRLRIDLLCDMLNKVRTVKTTPKGSKKLTRTDSDVSLSESLYDTLFCEDDSKINESERSKTKTRKKSFDVSQVVTACLDNMAAKTGIIKIQKQSHMDRWLQKAKSKTPEKSQFKSQSNTKPVNGRKRRKSKVTVESDNKKSYRLTLSDNESLNEVDYKLQAYQNDHDYSSQLTSNCIDRDNILDESNENVFFDSEIAATGFGIITKVESLSDNDVSNKSLDGDLVISSDCIIGETTIIDSNNSLVEQDGVSILIINDVRSMQDDVASKIEIPAITSNLDECQKVTTSGSENILTEISNKKTDGENKAVVFSPKESILKNTDLTATTDSNNLQMNHSKIIEQMNTNISEIKNIQTITDLQPHLNNGYTENLNTCLNYTDVGPLSKVKPIFNKTDNIVEENVDINYSKRLQNTNTTGNSVTNLTNGHIEDMENKKPVSGSKKTNDGQSNEESTENSRDCTFKNQDNVLCEENQGKQDVNIVKTILSDKLVGNIVDFNKTAFTIELNEMSTDKKITVNYDIDLTIPETNGYSNRTITDDCHDKETSSTYKYDDELKMLEDNSSSDSSKVTGNQESDKEVQSTFNNDNTLVSTVNSSCSNIFHGDSNQDTDSFETVNTDNESITSDTLKSNNDTGFVPNGTLTNDDSIESDSTLRNCDLSFSSDDDDRSNNSTPTNCDEFSIIEKRKIRLIRKLHKNITLQDALLLKDVVNGTNDIDERMASQNEMVSRIDGQDTCSREIIKANDEINSVYDKSDQSIGESIRRSKRYSMDSSNTSESDNKSVNGEDLIKIPETSDSLDVDESIERSENVTGNVIAHEHKVVMHADLGQEKVILSGDELRLTPHGLEVTDNCPKNDVNGDEICVEKVKEELRLTPHCLEEENYSKNDVNGDEICVEKVKEELRLTPHCLEEENYPKNEVKEEDDTDTASIISTNSDISLSKRKAERLKAEKKSLPNKKSPVAKMDDPEFLKYMELKQDAIYEENPELSEYEITTYLYNTWLYEESLKTDRKKSDDIESANMVKGLQLENVKPKKVKKRVKTEKETDCEPIKVENVFPKQKPKRRTPKASYNEEYSDIEEDLEVFRIPKPKELKAQVLKIEEYTEESNVEQTSEVIEIEEESEVIDEVEEYFARLTEPKPNVFKGLLREKVCEICEKVDNLVKCKGCCCRFHIDCVKKETEVVEVQVPMKGRKKKKKTKGRKSRSDDNLDGSQSDERDVNVSEELVNTSMDNIEMESHIEANADDFEAQLAIKMKELIGDEVTYESSADELDWSDIEPGKCEVIDVKPRSKNDNELTDHSDFKCNNCQKYDVPVCFVCRSPESPKNRALHRQRCQVAQCNKYFHLECLEHWPQTQFNSGECARYNKEVNEYFEPLTCPRHVCHTCVSDDPRGCKTRFCGDKLARCVRCPATYHSFTKCLPAGSKILTGSHIICPRHVEHRPGKVPCHVNTGWCFICALGGTLICCEYCPTSFHAECLNIKPPEGGYMCEDCETGRLPLYGEMVWVKLGHYRWWPGIILHPSEIPENILAVKHSPGEFVVRFFGQYDHYWVNRGRVFPFQEGDTGKVSSQKSKIDAAFTMAIEHAQRACEILKSASPNEEESLDIASSLLPPHYVKLRVNKPCGALCARRVDEESSLTQCECSPHDDQPCGPYSHCLNRMLLTECGPTCRAGERCHNRAFEKRLYPKLTPYRTPHRGWGLKTLEDIKAGQFVIEYVGEVIDEEEFQRRMRRKHEIRDENYYFLTLDKERMIDAGPKGNLARFMNHCCEPNCETQKWTVLGDVRVGLFALYDIPANSEVTFNYNLESAGIEKKQCMCGAKRCSGYIGAKPKQMDQPKKPKRPYNKKKERKIDDSPSTSRTKPKTGKLGRPPRPKELTEIEKDLLIIKNATTIDSDSPSIDSRPLKRKRNGLSMEEAGVSVKKIKMVEESSDGCD